MMRGSESAGQRGSEAVEQGVGLREMGSVATGDEARWRGEAS